MKVKVEVLCRDIILDEKRFMGEIVEVDKSIVDAINEMDEGYGSPRIKVFKKPAKKVAKKKAVDE